MTSQVLKYKLKIGETVLPIPGKAQILSVHEQCGDLQLWALVHHDDLPGDRKFRVVATGQPFENDVRDQFIGTVLQLDGVIVFHVFEVFQ